jgi:hypothetical protein
MSVLWGLQRGFGWPDPVRKKKYSTSGAPKADQQRGKKKHEVIFLNH